MPTNTMPKRRRRRLVTPVAVAVLGAMTLMPRAAVADSQGTASPVPCPTFDSIPALPTSATTSTPSPTAGSSRPGALTAPSSQRDLTGYSVAVSGETAVVGAPGHGLTGAVDVFRHDRDGWVLESTLVPPDGSAGDAFGYAVAINHDTIIVGAIGHGQHGAAYVFDHTAAEWVEESELVGSDSATGDLFGYSVAVAPNTIAVGAPNNAQLSGSVYLFGHSGEHWAQQAEFTANGGYLGYSVAAIRDTVLVGEPFDTTNNIAGSAHVYRRSGSDWSEQANLTVGNSSSTDNVGWSVALSPTRAVVTAPDTNHNTGAAYVFDTNDGRTWHLAATLTASDGAPGDCFGWSTALAGDTVLVGAFLKNNGQGAAYTFEHTRKGWIERSELTAPHPSSGDLFGRSVARSPNASIIGAPGTNAAGGSAYAFDPTPSILAAQ